MQLKISIEYILADMSIHSSKYKTCSCFMFETNQMCMLLKWLQIVAVVPNTVVATMTFTGVKPSISTSDVALKANPGTVLKTSRPDDSKTPPTCSN